MRGNRGIFIFCFFALSVFSCKKDISPKWETEYEIPLLKSSLTIGNILPDSLLTTNGDQSYVLIFRNKIYDINLDSLFSLPDTISHKYMPGLGGLVINPGQSIFNVAEETKFDFGGADVSRVDVRSGFIVVDIINSVQEDIIVTYTIQSATRNGVPFTITEIVPAATPPALTHLVKKFDISGYSLDLTGSTHLLCNRLNTLTSATLDPFGDTVTLTNQDQFNFFVNFEDATVKYARGYFGSEEVVYGPDTTLFDVFKNFTDGELNLEEASLSITIDNGFGVDAQVIFDEISGLNSHSGNTVTLNDPLIGQSINISRSQETYNPADPVIPSHYEFNLDNSNITEFIGNLPDMLRYAAEIEVNPMGNVSSGNDFLYYGHYLDANLDLEIPLSFSAQNLTLVDSIELDLSDASENNHILSGTLMLFVDNGFPFSATISIDMLNDDGSFDASLIDQGFIAAAEIDENNIAVGTTGSVLTIVLDEDKLRRLFATKKLGIRAVFNTAGAGQYVQLYSNYKMDIKLTARFNYLMEQ